MNHRVQKSHVQHLSANSSHTLTRQFKASRGFNAAALSSAAPQRLILPSHDGLLLYVQGLVGVGGADRQALQDM